jgi:hypothetical protein
MIFAEPGFLVLPGGGRLGNHLRKPRSYCRSHGFGVRLEAVISLHLHHLATRSRGRHAERIPYALNDERRHRHGFELGQAALHRLPCAARRFKREGEAEHRNGAGCLRGAAGDSGAQRATADDDLQVSQFDRVQVLDDRDPRPIELRRSGRRPPSRDPVGLLNERDADPY